MQARPALAIEGGAMRNSDATAQPAIDEKTVNDRAEREGTPGVSAECTSPKPRCESIAPAFAVEPQQVFAECVTFADPQFADHRAGRKHVGHV